jgi:hypothetical protein
VHRSADDDHQHDRDADLDDLDPSTTLYGSPSRAFVDRIRGLLD